MPEDPTFCWANGASCSPDWVIGLSRYKNVGVVDMTQDTILNIVFFLVGLGFGMFQMWMAQKERISDQQNKIGAINQELAQIAQRLAAIEPVTNRLVQMELTLGRVDGMVPRLNEVVSCVLKIEKAMDVLEKVAFQPTGQPAYAPRRPAPAAGAATSEVGTFKREFANPQRRAGTPPAPDKKNEAFTPDPLPPVDAALVIDDAAGRVYLGAQKLELTTLEYCLLRSFAQQTGQILSWEALAEKIRLYVEEEDRGRLPDLLAALIGRLRKKLGDDPDHPTYLGTVPGFGWVLQHATYIPPSRR